MTRLSLKASNTMRKRKLIVVLMHWLEILNIVNWFYQTCCILVEWWNGSTYLKRRYVNDFFARREIIYNLAYESDTTCIAQLRMNRSSFVKLCYMLENEGGLKGTRFMEVDEQVAISLHLIAHHVKNRTIQFRFKRSGETISRQFSLFLNVVIRLQNEFFENPKPIAANSTDWRWKWFKNCLGALDGTHIKVRVPSEDRPRYRTRKGEIATNVLAACSQDMQFTYVLAGWEGSAADSRVLRDAITRNNGLKVPNGHYYLVDAGYTNCEGFLAPYRGQRYHLNEWRDGRVPRSPREFFNMKHSAARNVIERCFGLLKMRWAILRSPAYYPIRTQTRIILACCLLQNFIRREMVGDLAERRLERRLDSQQDGVDEMAQHPVETIETSSEFSNWRDNLANDMFNEWNSST